MPTPLPLSAPLPSAPLALPVIERAFDLPEPFLRWFAGRGWAPRAHQLELLARTQAGESSLLIAPTGAGKTLAGFLPSLVDVTARARSRNSTRPRGIHTLYISPLKALATDIERNLSTPVEEIGLPVTIETRTGDTSAARRTRQRLRPPDILLTTPEQLTLMIAQKDAAGFFEDLEVVILDELHSLVTSKRGHLLSLAVARLRAIRPMLRSIGLSATVAEPDELRRWLVRQGPEPALSGLVEAPGGARPEITILASARRVPWAGHTARYAIPEIYEAIRAHRLALLFVNTRSQAELLFRDLWEANEDSLPIALHHGSLDVGQRRKVEAAMAANRLRAVVATSTLDLGIDWGDVDLVVHVGAPKGASRLAQRIGRANHRMDEPSRAILVPANRFEVLECQAALDANYLGAQDTPPMREGALDVLAQHILGTAVAGPFDADELFEEVRGAAPYADLPREHFDRCVDFVATGGYALRAYEQYAKIARMPDGRWRLTHPRFAQQYRMNAGTIIELPMLDVRLTREKPKGASARGGQMLGRIEEGFLETLVHGDTFLFAGRTVRYQGIRENACYVSDATDSDPRVPAYGGSKFPLTTFLAAGVRAMLSDPQEWHRLPRQVSDWLALQEGLSELPGRDDLLIETFPRGARHFLVAYPFEGRLAHQTLGMLLTKRLERAKLRPLGFVATDYALSIWALRDMAGVDLDALFDEDMLGDDLESWLDESYLLKRSFRQCATIAGLIEKRHPGREKTGRQMTVSADLVYDVLRQHEPDHLLMMATRQDAAYGLLDVRRLGELLFRIRGRIRHRRLARISPLAVPVLLEMGRERVFSGDAQEDLLAEAAADYFDSPEGLWYEERKP